MSASDVEQVIKACAEARRQGFMEAVEMFRHFGGDLPPDKALSDEERYILDQAADIIEDKAP